MYADPSQHKEIARLQKIAYERERAETQAPTNDQIREYLERESKTVAQESRERQNQEVAASWVSAHPEYAASPRSSTLMQEWLVARNLPMTQKNLTDAFGYLTQRGLVETNAESVQAAVREQNRAEEIRRRAQREAKTMRTYSDDELYGLPLDELADLARRHG